MEPSQAIKAEDIRRKFPPDWEVPEFRIDFWDGKTSDYCVVVPVINEGERIRQFVRRLKESKIDSIADIIIVDGGSTDESLKHDFLRSNGVRGLLTKTDTGKLSSQLRVAYSFLLCNEYLGFVTIDGNNKDDPADIPGIISALAEGNDFVQASRFIRGGVSVNTPLARYMAIRFIHAPLLSLASGFHWTDTTQGFRGYSRVLLSSAKIKLFRSVFFDYELLAYLSARAPRIGLKCVEVPSTRVYPKGQIPTKISVITGNLAIVKTLIKSCLCIYDPP